MKRYGVLSHACHVAPYIWKQPTHALRRFISMMGTVRQLRCDRGTNFVGAKHELRDALTELDEGQLQPYLSKEGCDYIPFKVNVPSASHPGSVRYVQYGMFLYLLWTNAV